MPGCALGTSGPPTPISRLPLQPLGGIKINVGMRFGTSGPPTPILRLPPQPLGESKPMLECALGTSGPASEIQTPLATARGNQGQCWNAFGNLWATAPISRLSLQPPGELKPMLECALGTSRPPTLISSLPCNCSGIKANVGMRCGNLVGADSDIHTSLGTAWGNQGHATSLTSSPPQPPFRQMAHGYCPVSH